MAGYRYRVSIPNLPGSIGPTTYTCTVWARNGPVAVEIVAHRLARRAGVHDLDFDAATAERLDPPQEV